MSSIPMVVSKNRRKVTRLGDYHGELHGFDEANDGNSSRTRSTGKIYINNLFLNRAFGVFVYTELDSISVPIVSFDTFLGWPR